MSQIICALRPDIKRKVLKLGLSNFSDAINSILKRYNVFRQVEEEDALQNSQMHHKIFYIN